MPLRPKYKCILSRLALRQIVALFAMFGWSIGAFAQNDTLPELGDQATEFLSPLQESRIGQQFLRQLLRDPDYVSDPELIHYLNQLGDQIGQFADLRGTKLHFNLLRNNNLNAFAVPGGYITFNTGLVLNTEHEDELASVIGHEIAHLSQRHLPRLLAKSEESKLPATAAIIAAILVGGQVGAAGITVANATLLSNQLSYTRGFEREADAIGIRMLAAAGYDPRAMGRFFGKMDRYSREQGITVPEFLRTHPLSYNRIAESEARAESYPKTSKPSSEAYYLAKAKIQASWSERSSDTIALFKNQIDITSGIEQDAATYGLSLAYLEYRQYDAAKNTLAPLLQKHPANISFQIAQSQIEVASGRANQAADRMGALQEAHPGQVWLTHYHARALLAANQATRAKKLLRYHLRRYPQMFSLYPLLSEANVKLGLLGEAHQSDAEYDAAIGDYNGAIAALKLALRDMGDNPYLEQSVSARMAQLENRRALQRKIPKP